VQKEKEKAREAEKRARRKSQSESSRNDKKFAEEVAAARKRRESQRAGYRAGESPYTNDSQQLPHVIPDSRPLYDRYYSSSSNPSTSKSDLGDPRSRRSSITRPSSYASSGEESPTGLSSTSAKRKFRYPSVGGSSSEDLNPGRRESGSAPASSSSSLRSRGKSTRSKHASHSPEDVPPVPFLARNWDTAEIPPFPAAHTIQHGPFMASVRSQKRSSLKASYSAEDVERTFANQNASYSFVRPSHPRGVSEQSTRPTGRVPNPVPHPSSPKRSSVMGMQPSPGRHPPPNRRGTMLF